MIEQVKEINATDVNKSLLLLLLLLHFIPFSLPAPPILLLMADPTRTPPSPTHLWDVRS